MIRLDLDTNILVAAAYAPRSASRRIIDACRTGWFESVLSSHLKSEYEYILPRAIRGSRYEVELKDLIESAIEVEPPQTPRVVPDDPEDDKLIAAALAAEADFLITNDRHLLELDPYQSVRIVRPGEFVRKATWPED